MDILTLLTGLDGVATVAQIIIGLILTELSKKVKITNNFKQAVSWVICIGIGFIYNYLGIGLFVGLSWYTIIAFGFVVGLITNGVFDIKTIRDVITTISSQRTNQQQ